MKITRSGNTSDSLSTDRGFTLVEIAVVMIIVGLLIGGVLTGQALIDNAKTTATVAQIKSLQAAILSFKDMYSALPGDIRNPGAVLPNCATPPCAVGGDGNGLIDTEPRFVPVHLAAAGLLTGYGSDGTGGLPTDLAGLPDELGAKIGNGAIFWIYSSPGGTGLTTTYCGTSFVAPVNIPSGILVNLNLQQSAATGCNGSPVSVLTPNQAFRIDTKMDDGVPATGNVLAWSQTPTLCGSAKAYLGSSSGATCALIIQLLP